MADQSEYTELIELILSGNRIAYGELYEKTIQDVYRNVYFLLENKSDVDDVIQDIYIQAYKSLKKYDSNRQFKPWLMGIAMKQIQSYRRKRWRQLRIAKKVEKYQQGMVLDIADDIIDKIDNKHLVSLVESLPYKLKQVIILRYLNEYSQEDVAKIIGIPIGTVKSRISAALKKLRQHGYNSHPILLEKVRNA